MTDRSSQLTARFSRRRWLQATGAASVLAPFVPLLSAKGELDGPPHRLLLVYHPNGCPAGEWRPSGGETDFVLGGTLAGLERHRQRLLVLGSLKGAWPNEGPGDAHWRSMSTLWTGTQISDSGWPTGPSVDQVIADRIGGDTPFRSLEFGAQTNQDSRGNHVSTRMIYGPNGESRTPTDNPYTMFDRLFEGLDTDSAEIEALRARRKSVLDLVMHDLDSLAARHGAEDRAKLEAHHEAIRAIERRLDGSIQCSVPTIEGGVDHKVDDNFGAVIGLQTQLLVQALACDLTRVASFQWQCSYANTVFDWLGFSAKHHRVMHDATDADEATIHRWFVERFAELLDALDAVPEGDGTLLDHTTVVWGSEMGNGNHQKDPIPYVIAGGPYFRLGRYVTYDSALPRTRMLTTLCHAMGLQDVESFGDVSPGGPLPNLT